MQSLSDETTNVLQRQCFHLEMQDMIDLAELVDAINPIYVIILGVLIAAGENSSKCAFIRFSRSFFLPSQVKRSNK